MKKPIKTMYELLLQLLTNNKDKWLTGDYIRHWMYYNTIGGLKISAIELRDMIKHLRFGGHPIIASSKGYKYTNSIIDLQTYILARKTELESELNILRKMEGKW